MVTSLLTRRLRAFACALFLAFAVTPFAAHAGEFEVAVLEELNFARTNPVAYARDMMRQPAAYGGGRSDTFADQDPAAFEEAIEFLHRQPRLPPLRANTRLAAAARDHADSQGSSGSVGHGGRRGDGPAQRLQRHGVWASLSAENISYGSLSPREVVQQLIIDAGVPSRGHRKNIFGRGYDSAGVACGRHRNWGGMCVIEFAGAIQSR
jgi:uncharacterized protein YkwD